MKEIEKVVRFWEKNPLWTGKSNFETGSKDFFEEHRSVYINGGFGGKFDIRFLPPPRQNGQNMSILDLACGIGFWVTELAMRGYVNLTAADLTQNALAITGKRLETYGLKADLAKQNAEKLSFEDESFDHINCQGVIHHTPNTEQAIAQMARVLKPGGTASISAYYRNWFLMTWPFLRWIAWPLAKLGGGLKKRGRENIFLEKDVDQIVRLYDGDSNPIGKSYTKNQFIDLLKSEFTIDKTYLHFFPARTLPFKIPKSLHRWLDQKFGFMIYATVRKNK